MLLLVSFGIRVMPDDSVLPTISEKGIIDILGQN